jgi:hypothetical protein
MRYFFALAGLLSLAAPSAAADEVTNWNDIAGRASVSSGMVNNPLFDSRVYALTHVAIHDALNAIDRRYRSYAYHGSGAPTASTKATVAEAAYRVLTNQYSQLGAFGIGSPQAMLDAEYTASLASIPAGPSKAAGIAVGNSAATAILTLRAGDGWNQQTMVDTGYPQGSAPGEWRFTPPNDFAFAPQWGNMQPFALFRSNQYRPSPPYKVNSKRYTEDFNEIKALGGDGVITPSARTADQTEIARFWYESSPLGWNRIARTVSHSKGLGLWENARLFALLNLASVDGYIANFESKYHYLYWRPVTAIRLADSDGNPDTIGDPTWISLLETPPVPDYASGHSVQGGALAEILKLFFGADRIGFTTCSTTMLVNNNCGEAAQILRSFSTFSQAAEENALSRILVGIHFRKATSEGMEHGRKIAHHVYVHYLRPLR